MTVRRPNLFPIMGSMIPKLDGYANTLKGLALMAVLALPFSLVLLVPAAWIWYKRQK